MKQFQCLIRLLITSKIQNVLKLFCEDLPKSSTREVFK